MPSPLLLKRQQRDAAGQRHVALVAQQALGGQRDRHQRGRAGGLHGDAWAAQAQLVRDPRRQEVLFATQHSLEAADRPQQIAVRVDVIEQVGIHPRAGIHADAPAVLLRVVAGPLQRLPGALQEQALLRVHDLGLAGVVAEERRIEQLNPIQKPAGRHILRVVAQRRVARQRPVLGRHEEADRLDAAAQVAPELLDAAGAGEPAGHADDRDALQYLLLAHRAIISSHGCAAWPGAAVQHGSMSVAATAARPCGGRGAAQAPRQ
jgi:hypothetical protein